MVAVAFMPRLLEPHPDRRRGATPEHRLMQTLHVRRLVVAYVARAGQASLRDAIRGHMETFPGVETPGYQRGSCRDRTAVTGKTERCLKLPDTSNRS